MEVQPWTSPQRIRDMWLGKPLPATSDPAIELWIARAERLIRREFPDIQDRLDKAEEPDLLETIRDVVTAMVSRVLRNPEGFRQITRTDGNFSASATTGGELPGELMLTTKEADSLEPPLVPAEKRRAFTIQPALRPRIVRM